MIPALVGRITFTGELGYELWVTPDYHVALYDTLLAAGAAFGLRHFGLRALNSHAAGKGIWHLGARVPANLWAVRSRAWPFRQPEKGRVHRPRGGAAREGNRRKTQARHADRGRVRRRRGRRRAGRCTAARRSAGSPPAATPTGPASRSRWPMCRRSWPAATTRSRSRCSARRAAPHRRGAAVRPVRQPHARLIGVPTVAVPSRRPATGAGMLTSPHVDRLSRPDY